jgi:hypothetical protein
MPAASRQVTSLPDGNDSVVEIAGAMRRPISANREQQQRFSMDRGRPLDQSALMIFFGPTEEISHGARSIIRPSQKLCRFFHSLGPIKTQRCANNR